jgi:hypothetical protein
MGKKGYLTIDAHGVETVGLEKWLTEKVGQWFPVPAPEGMLILEGPGDGEVDIETGVRLAGTIMAPFELTDILGMIHHAKWEGSFHVRAASVQQTRKTLFLRNGDIVGAASTARQDRLGEILCAQGVVTPAQLQEALDAGGLSKLALTVVQRGLITAQQLHAFLRHQVEQIFFSVVFLSSGTYYFHQRPLRGSSWEHLRLSTESLMLEGIRRVDQMRMFQEVLPAPHLPFQRTPNEFPGHLSPADRQFLDAVDGQRSMNQLAQALGLDEYEATQRAHRLFQAGLIQQA